MRGITGIPGLKAGEDVNPVNGYPVVVKDVQQLNAIRLGVDAIGLPTQTGPDARPKRSPEDLPAQFRVITTHTIEAPPIGRRGRIIQPEYDFAEIAKAIDTDGLLSRACQAHLNCIMKDGWSLAGRNDKTKSYIQSRLDDLTFMSQLSFTQIIRQAAQDLVCFHNFFIYLVRDASRSAGRPIRFHGKQKDPIAALHPMDPTSMYPVLGDTVEIRKWVQYTDGRSVSGRWVSLQTDDTKNSKTYPPEDVIHGWYFRRTGFIFGTPQATPVLDDIRALRRLEEIAELIAHKHAFPLIHLKVGTETLPAKQLGDGTHEVDLMTRKYQQLPLEGAIVTSERVEVVAIKVDPLDLSKLLDHYEKRAITGLGISDIDVGRGDSANRGTAVVTSRALLDRCREYQRVLAEILTLSIIDVLLLEGNFELTPENRVFLSFAEVDIERRNATENHALTMYQGGLMTETEARLAMGRDPITEAMREDMHFKRLDEPLAIIKAIDEPYTNPAKAKASSASQPTNQAGKKSAKTTPVNVRVRGDALTKLQITIADCVESQRVQEVPFQITLVVDCIRSHTDQIQRQMTNALLTDLRSGMQRYVTDGGSPVVPFVGQELRDQLTQRCVQVPLDALLNPEHGEIAKLLKGLDQTVENHDFQISTFFQTWESRWNRLEDRLKVVAQRFGYLYAAQSDTQASVVWSSTDTACAYGHDAESPSLSLDQATYYGLLGCICRKELQRLPKSLESGKTAV